MVGVFLFLPASEPDPSATSSASGAGLPAESAVSASQGAPRAFATEGPRDAEAASAAVDEALAAQLLTTDPYPWPLATVGLDRFPRRVADIVAGLYTEYLALEADATRVLSQEAGQERVLHVEAFVAQREELVQRLWKKLAVYIYPDPHKSPIRSIRLDVLFPLGEVSTVIGITRVPEGFHVRVDADGSQTSVSTGALGWQYARFWRE